MAGSFRDPAGSLYWHGRDGNARLLRVVRGDHAAEVRSFLSSATARKSMERGELVGSRIVPDLKAEVVGAPGEEGRGAGAAPQGTEGERLVVEHEVVPFPSYPGEWPAPMLHAAGELTVELCQRSLAEGRLLKDATPRNVLFRGSAPVFVDIPSFEPREAGVPVWKAYSQFLQGFLLPLLLYREVGLDPRRFASPAGDGLSPSEAVRALPWLRRLRPRNLSLATIPAALNRGGRRLRSRGRSLPRLSPEAADAALRRQLRSARRHLRSLEPTASAESSWTGYQAQCHYSDEDRAEKRRVVERVLVDEVPRALLDLGCNEGEFSEMGARAGATVVALDADPDVVGRVWRRSWREGMDILPLAADLADPTPPAGWRNGEQRSLLERLHGRFDVVLALALVHHLLVTQRVPLGEILELLKDLTRPGGVAVVEYVPPDDPRFRELAWGREELFRDLTVEVFREAFQARFQRVSSVSLPDSGRELLVGRRPTPGERAP